MDAAQSQTLPSHFMATTDRNADVLGFVDFFYSVK